MLNFYLVNCYDMDPLQRPLERLIQQRVPFKSPRARVEVGLMILAGLLQHDMNRYFKPFGITPQQYNVLRILRGQYPNPVPINLIKERVIDKMCDASRIVDRLVKLELAEKTINLRDKRVADVVITNKALTLMEDVDIHFYDKQCVAYSLNDADTELFNNLIDKMLASRV
jgi:DNA-binding MarR family transcriptional regulator